MINIIHVVYGDTGGAGRIVLEIAKNHDRTRFRPVVVLLGYEIDPLYLTELKEHDIEAVTVIKNKSIDISFLSKLREILSSYKPDVLLLHTPVAYYWGRIASLGLGIKQVISVEHLAMSNYYSFLGRFVNMVQSHFISDKIICVSNDVKNLVKKELWLPERKFHVIENGLSVNQYPQIDPTTLLSSKPTRIKMVSRLDGQKDPNVLIQAIRLLLDEGFDVKLEFVGDGSLRREMEDLIDQLGIQEQVKLLGMRNDVNSLLLDTDIFVLSTHGEGLPIALLEAMSIGIPAIATAVQGVVGVLEDGVNGLLVPEHDAKALSEAISSLIDNSEKARQMAANARQKAEQRYSIARTVKDYEDFLIAQLS